MTRKGSSSSCDACSFRMSSFRNDAYNEFAEATLAEIATLKGKLDREWVVAQLRDATLPVHRRRLCWTFLSQCGYRQAISRGSLMNVRLASIRRTPSSRSVWMRRSPALLRWAANRALRNGSNKTICTNPSATYSETFAAVSAIRVHATELGRSSRATVLRKRFECLLDRPDLADLVIADLARLQDWSAVDQMVELFQSAPQEKPFAQAGDRSLPQDRAHLPCSDDRHWND